MDGETIALANGRSVRLLGYDSPEVGECGYDQAASMMAVIVQRPVRLLGKDQYGRILAYVKSRRGRDVGTIMLQRGLTIARYDSLNGYPWHPKQDPYEFRGSTNGDITRPEQTPEPPPPAAPPLVTPPQSVQYENCDAVRSARAAPIYQRQPGYGDHLDRDGDGVGCEE